MEGLSHLDPMTIIILAAAALIIVLVLFNRVIHVLLKVGIIAVMVTCILYFLRQEGLI